MKNKGMFRSLTLLISLLLLFKYVSCKKSSNVIKLNDDLRKVTGEKGDTYEIPASNFTRDNKNSSRLGNNAETGKPKKETLAGYKILSYVIFIGLGIFCLANWIYASIKSEQQIERGVELGIYHNDKIMKKIEARKKKEAKEKDNTNIATANSREPIFHDDLEDIDSPRVNSNDLQGNSRINSNRHDLAYDRGDFEDAFRDSVF